MVMTHGCCSREVIVAMVMTAADLSSNYKHFATQKRTVVDLFEEFYQQVLLSCVIMQDKLHYCLYTVMS